MIRAWFEATTPAPSRSAGSLPRNSTSSNEPLELLIGSESAVQLMRQGGLRVDGASYSL
jgi:hypothetical protein